MAMLIIQGTYLPINLIGFRSDLVAVCNLAFVTKTQTNFSLCIYRDISYCNLSSPYKPHYMQLETSLADKSLFYLSPNYCVCV